MITALLSTAVCFCLWYGRIDLPALIPACLGVGVFVAVLNRHQHDQPLLIDAIAQMSRLNRVNPALKLGVLFALMVLCVASNTVITGLFLMVVMTVLAVVVGGLSLHHYMRVAALPLSFLLVGVLALLVQVLEEPAGILNVNLGVWWFSVTLTSQATAALVIARALGAVSCLFLISLTTPLPEIIGVLRRLRVPTVVIDLMYLIYRYVFIVVALNHEMRDAAKSRLGFRTFRSDVRSTGMIYSNLLSCSYRAASLSFDAMESRCYQEGIVFLEQRIPVRALHAVVAFGLLVVCLCLCAFSLFAPACLPF